MAQVCGTCPHGPQVFDLPWPLLTKEGKRLLNIKTMQPKADRFIRFLPFVRGGQEG